MWFKRDESSETPPRLVTHRDEDKKAAIVFIHGFHGDLSDTWELFPEFLTAEPALDEWDVLSVGYETNLRLDLARLWSAAAPLDRLAGLFRTVAENQLDGYETLAIVAHSMGGLVVQRAILDDERLASRLSFLFLFGTPSAGLAKAGLARFWKRQLRDMGSRSKFIEKLRSDWDSRYSDGPPFELLAVAGTEDEFVGPSSSIEPFAEKHRAVVHGNHLDIVKPTSSEALSVRVVANQIVGDAAPAGPWNSARVALELGDFRRAIERLEPHKDELDEDSLVELALALEADGRTEDAFALLKETRHGGMTDAIGVLAGRYKRRWMATGRRADAERAHELYSKGRDLAFENEDADQSYYHLINVAFLETAYRKDPERARLQARLALHQVERSRKHDHWALATQAEAHLYLDAPEKALSKYRQALSTAPTPREIESIFDQAVTAAGCLGKANLVERLRKIFKSAKSLSSEWA